VQFSSGFVPYLVKAMHAARDDIGTDIMGTDHSRYLQYLEIFSLIAMVMKAVQDLAPTQATDAVWAQRLSISIDTGPGGDRSGWPGWIILQVPPEQLSQYGATETDSPAVLQAKIDAYNAMPGH
jgi:hypothetical protein